MHSLLKRWQSVLVRTAAAIAVAATLVGTADAAQPKPASFESPQVAAQKLVDAVKAKDRKAVLGILGASARPWILSGDRVADAEAFQRFVEAYDQKHGLAQQGDAKATLLIGPDDFPFPFPIVKDNNAWRFDPEQGREEILNRRIGRNELSTIQVLLATVDAQRDYAAADRDGNGLLEYAQRFTSSPGKKDGLYWPTKAGEPESPLGSLVGQATREGYAHGRQKAGGKPAPYHGYYFKILKGQGSDAPGGAYDYVARGRMIGGYAVLAYPARYGNSGVKSFLVNHEGVIFEKDLGQDTAAAAGRIARFNPDSSWKRH